MNICNNCFHRKVCVLIKNAKTFFLSGSKGHDKIVFDSAVICEIYNNLESIAPNYCKNYHRLKNEKL